MSPQPVHVAPTVHCAASLIASSQIRESNRPSHVAQVISVKNCRAHACSAGENATPSMTQPPVELLLLPPEEELPDEVELLLLLDEEEDVELEEEDADEELEEEVEVEDDDDMEEADDDDDDDAAEDEDEVLLLPEEEAAFPPVELDGEEEDDPSSPPPGLPAHAAAAIPAANMAKTGPRRRRGMMNLHTLKQRFGTRPTRVLYHPARAGSPPRGSDNDMFGHCGAALG